MIHISQPVHLHLIDFLVLRRESTEASDIWVDYDPLVPGGSPGDKFTTIGSSDGLRPWEVGAPKDVVHLGHGQDVWVLTHWGPHDGDFMFHCHNLVHEDNVSLCMYRFYHALCGCVTHVGTISCLSFQDMMVAAGVGRKSVVDGVTYFDDGEREEGFLHTNDQEDKYYETTGAQVAVEDWSYTEGAFEGDGGSPYSPQTGGQINSLARSGMGDPALPVGTDTLNSNYVCSEMICQGFYEVFYPDPTTSLGADQLAYRPDYPETSDNPIRQNIWAIPYNAFSDGMSDDFMTVDSEYTASGSTHTCTCNL